MILLSGAIIIQAWLPLGEALHQWKEQLQAVAVSAGCAAPVAAARWEGGERPVFIEITCPEPAPPPVLPP